MHVLTLETYFAKHNRKMQGGMVEKLSTIKMHI